MLGPLVCDTWTQILPLGMGLPWITLRDSNDTPSAWTVLFPTYATSCVSAFCTEADVELVVAGVDIEEGWTVNLIETPEEDDWACTFFPLPTKVDGKGVES